MFLDLPDGRTVAVGRLSGRINQAGVLLATEFEYSATFLADPSRYTLCPELPVRPGRQVSSPARPMFGAFADSQPDRWGRNLLHAAERRTARSERRRPRSMTEMDFLLGVRDDTRQGALRFSLDGGATFVSPARPGVPELADLPALVAAARRHLEHAETDEDLALLVGAGTSMGGARPKATVALPDGRLALAKLPHPDDRWDVLAWEAATLELARRAGIVTPPFQHHRIDPDQSILVTHRFDRDGVGRRVAYLSAHSMVEKTDAMVVPYTMLAEILTQGSAAPRRDAADLFRRVAFSLLVNNVDDHVKNHGVLRTESGWRLAPVFDVDPFPAEYPVDSTPLADDDDGTRRDIRHLLDTADFYGLSTEEAQEIVAQVAAATDDWADVARSFGIASEDLDHMSSAFESDNRSRAHDIARRSNAPDAGPTGTGAPAGEVWVRPHTRNGRAVAGHFRTRSHGQGTRTD